MRSMRKKHASEIPHDPSHKNSLKDSSNPTLLEDAVERLKKTSLKVTKPRLTVLKALTHGHGPYSAEELKKLPVARSLDLVTIYRCLAHFESEGLARRCDFGDGIARFEFANEHDHHHHVICRVCRKTQTLDDCMVDPLTEAVKKLGYQKIGHVLEFFGVCQKCQ